ncbi:MAG: hypothetical protein GXO49_01310, partial [Chlorobi bacterium]|nr:hypothetical protein [Chlorobiota bacterium]
ENAKVIFAVPFKNNPIVHNLVSLISQPIMNLGLSFDYETVVMTEEEKENYFKLEKIGWKELD